MDGLANILPDDDQSLERNRFSLHRMSFGPTEEKPKASATFECPVCYEEVPKNQVVALKCDHKFCTDCVKGHITSNLESGKAVSLKCMEAGCPERYGLNEVTPFLTEEQLKVFKAIN